MSERKSFDHDRALFESGEWRLVAVIDTRDRDDDWRPVRGTGEPEHCRHCGREIEVHCFVEDVARGITELVGTSCAKRAKVRDYGAGWVAVVGFQGKAYPGAKQWRELRAEIGDGTKTHHPAH